MQETPVWFLGREDPWRRDRLPTPVFLGFPGGSDSKRIHLQCGKPGFDPWVGKIPWRRAWQPTPVFLPGESPWTEEPGRLQSTGSQRVGHDWVTKYSIAQFRTHILTVLRKNLNILGMGDIKGTCNLCWKIKLSPECSHLHFFFFFTNHRKRLFLVLLWYQKCHKFAFIFPAYRVENRKNCRLPYQQISQWSTKN